MSRELLEQRTAAAGASSAGPSPEAIGRRQPEPEQGRGDRGFVALVAAAAFAAAVATSLLLFPYLSLNVDEAVYILQARTLLDGHLTLPAEQAQFFQPMFTGVRNGHLAFKYAPVWPAVLAASEVLVGTMRAALGVTAASAVVCFAGFASEVLADRHARRAAVVLFAASPLVVVQSATFLSYLFSLALSLGFAWALLRGVRTGSSRLVVAAGVALGLGLFTRPFDTVLFCLPVAVAVAVELRRDLPALARTATVLALAAIPLVAVSLVFNRHVTGSALTPPFQVTDELDTIGFGRRRIYPSFASTQYDLGDGVEALGANATSLVRWVLGGPVLVALAVGGLWATRRRGAWLLLGLTVSVPLGYVFFWGAYNVSRVLGATEVTGPFYYLPVVVPVCLLAAVPIGALQRARGGAAVGVAIGALVVVSAALVWRPVGADLEVSRGWQEPYGLIEEADLHDAVVLLPNERGMFLLQNFRALMNRPDLGGPVVYALDPGPERLPDLLAQVPGRRPWRLRFGPAPGTGAPPRWHLEPLPDA